MISTNNVPRPVIDAYELTASERAKFDYLDWNRIEIGEDSASFFRYRDSLYDLGDAQRITETMTSLSGWHGFYGESYFSAVVFRYSDDFEHVTVGHWTE